MRPGLIFLLAAFLTFVQGAPAMAGNPAGPVLSLQEALVHALERNFDLRAERLNISIGGEDVVVEEARFDPFLDAALSADGTRTPTASALSAGEYARRGEYAGSAGIGKSFVTGLDARASVESSRLTTNSAVEGLDPQYRTFFFLDLRQPLLRDFGPGVQTADLRISENRLQQARHGYLDQAQRLIEQIELAYYELARTLEILQLRIESRELARELLEANRHKFEAGIVPITEVQEAESAMAGRDEQVVFARQQAETAANRLRDLMEIGRDHPLASIPLRTEPLPGIDQLWPQEEEALGTALLTRSDLKIRRLEIVSRDIRLEFLANQKLPRLDLHATLGVNGLSGEERAINGSPGSVNRGDYWSSVDRAAAGDGYQWFAGLSFSYPLGNRASEARHRRAAHEKRQVLFGLQSLENAVENEVRNALVTVERSYERVHVADRFQRLSDVTLSQEMERLAEGLSDTFRILEFQSAVIEARVRRINALVDFNQGLSSLYRAMGENLQRRGILIDPAEKENL